MRDFSDHQPAQSPDSSHKKRLGGYLVEAGLLTPAQVDVALNDQKLTGMRFGEILAARGWVKQKTIEYLMHKVVLPEQQVMKSAPLRSVPKPSDTVAQSGSTGAAQRSQPLPFEAPKQAAKREAPISKPLPSAGQSDGDISWVG